MEMKPEHKTSAVNRLKAVRGHIEAVIAMVEDERYCPDIMKQVSALQGSLEGVNRVQESIRDGWLLHFPAGTTRKGAPLRPGVSRLLHQARATVVPVRVDGFRELLLHKQIPGKLFKSLSVRIHSRMDLDAFYAEPYTKASGQQVLGEIESLIGDDANG